MDAWRDMMGPADPGRAKEASPDSLRARFGSNILRNAVHGSSSEQQAEEQIHLVFGDGGRRGDRREADAAAAGNRAPQRASYYRLSWRLLSLHCRFRRCSLLSDNGEKSEDRKAESPNGETSAGQQHEGIY